MTSLKMTVRADGAVPACSPLPNTIYKSSCTLVANAEGCGGWGWELAFGQMSATLPTPVAGVWNETDFPSHQSGLFIGFWAVSSQTTHLSVPVSFILILGHLFPLRVKYCFPQHHPSYSNCTVLLTYHFADASSKFPLPSTKAGSNLIVSTTIFFFLIVVEKKKNPKWNLLF